MLQAVRVTMMLDSHTGQRKALRMVRELRERIGITDEMLAEMLKPTGGGFQINPDVLTRPGVEVAMIPEEARRVLEILDSETLVARDLVWVEPLAKQLEALAA